ncbi:hypothetical protein JCM21714_3762 [Gracilibacillus boraciitolerans JCM 21714]|uniref:Uncharacterized protein n=1 Tax=Gracilibacillus boraciitolerans JCM 21714 TaxID=1298598 RepID=W4VMG6_9BACI|nr:hypothetical protein [Gracilibacillus boraciitolerans]GAE94590.1 hypothetical protein JCM21714_3762 [Gracilibacillus boraciitolerans JCM 21714]
MGTFYTLGVAKNFSARSHQSLSRDEWINLLNDRLDIKEYTISFKDTEVNGSLKKEVFKENIEDFYKKLVAIIENDFILNWFEYAKTDMERYESSITKMEINQENIHINLEAELAILFIEGKVMVEEFNTEPKLMNWLFRHVNLSNKLAGCVMSDIVG